MVGLFAGRAPPWGLNFSRLAFVPKGDEPADAVDVVRGAGQARPLTMKNTDVKAMARAVNHELSVVIGTRAHPVQQGFIRGRNFLKHIVAHDAYCRAASHHSEMMPVFVSFDFKEVFPSLSRQFLRRVLLKHKIPEVYVAFVDTVYASSLAHLPAGHLRSPYVLFDFWRCSGVSPLWCPLGIRHGPIPQAFGGADGPDPSPPKRPAAQRRLC